MSKPLTYNQIMDHKIDPNSPTLSLPTRQTLKIIDSLTDRQGFDDWFANMPEGAQDHVFENIREILQGA